MNHIGKSYNKDISLSHYSFELRNIVLHFTLKVSRLRLSQFLSIRLFRSQNRFSRMLIQIQRHFSKTFFKDIFQRHFSKVFSEVFFKEIFQEKIEEKIHEPSGVQPIKAIVGAMPCVNLSGLDKHPHSKGAFSF